MFIWINVYLIPNVSPYKIILSKKSIFPLPLKSVQEKKMKRYFILMKYAVTVTVFSSPRFLKEAVDVI